MKLVTFRRGGKAAEPGAILSERVVSLVGAGYHDLISLLAEGEEGRARVENWIYNPPVDAVAELASVKLLAPVPRPPKLICVGLNYRDHAPSRSGMPKVPTIFNKFPNTVIGPGDPIVLPKLQRSRITKRNSLS